MKEYTFEQFIKDVKKEVVALRKHAKTEELKKLSIYMLDPMQPTLCIYGLMTGDCRNERAADLIFKCCKRFIINERYEPWNVGEESILMSVNGTKIPGSNK